MSRSQETTPLTEYPGSVLPLMSQREDKETNGPFELKSADSSAKTPLRISFSRDASRQDAFANDDDDPAIGSMEPPVRNYGCSNYDTCLDLAAALNWASFTCGACKGAINQQLMWRARHMTRRDSVAKALCELPPVESVQPDSAAVRKRES